MEGYAEFEFDLPSALQGQLIALLDRMGQAALDKATTAKIEDAQGVYQLFHNGDLVYIGKTDAEAGLKTRLSRHAKKILHRPSFSGDVTFKAVRIMVFAAMDLERQLIDHYRLLKTGVAKWNGSGFGSNDPGRGREETNKPLTGFDATYPIDIDLPGDYAPAGEMTAASFLSCLKSSVPYTVRFETLRSVSGRALTHQPHPDLLRNNVVIPPPPQTVRSLMVLVRAALGREWQATVFVSHVILYKEAANYKYGKII